MVDHFVGRFGICSFVGFVLIVIVLYVTDILYITTKEVCILLFFAKSAGIWRCCKA